MAFNLRAQIAGQSALSGSVAPEATLAAWGGRTDEAQSALGARLTARFTDAAKDWGAVGDASTDNATALVAMREWMQSAPDAHHVVFFPPGEYRYTNNRWLVNVLSYEILGHGCTFRCSRVNDSSHVNNSQPIMSLDPWTETGESLYSAVTAVHNGYLVNSAALGALTVTCTTAAEAGNFVAGDRVVLHGFAQQFDGYPPNPRYFEYLKVVSAVAGTGVVTFETPLRFLYDAAWKDATVEGNAKWGLPRLMKLERAAYKFPRLAIYRGGHWTNNPNDTREANEAFAPCAEHLLLEDLDLDIWWPRAHKVARAERVRVEQCVEPDKLIDQLTLGPGCVFGGLGFDDSFREASGVQELRIDGARLHDVARIHSRSCVIRDSVIHGRSNEDFGIVSTSIWASRKLVIEDTALVNNHSAQRAFVWCNTIESVTVLGVSGAAITFTDNSTNRDHLHQRVEIGAFMATRDGVRGGKVTNIYLSGGALHVTGDWFVQPQASDVLYFDPMGELVLSRVRREGGRGRLTNAVYRAYPGKLTRYELRTEDVLWTGEDVASNFVRGRIVRIAASVDAVYTGAATTAFLELWDDDSGTGGNKLISFDLKAAGYREVTRSGSGGTTNDTFGSAHVGKWCHWLSVRPLGNGSLSGLAAATYAQLPKLKLTVDVLGP